MSPKNDKHADPATPETDTEAENATADTGVSELNTAQAPAEDMTPGEKIGDPVANLEGEVVELKNQLLRALAETENLRRRSARERDDAVKYAAVPLIKDVLAVADNLHRALTSVPTDAVEGNEQLKTLLDGVEMTEKELQNVLARHGIERIEPIGERLDPHFHEALFEIPDPSVPPGTVLRVLQAGYRLRDRLIRPAQVGVSKGGPRAAASSDGAGDIGDNGGGGNGGEDEKGRRNPGSQYDTSA
jgi:molecular chaperone GrpE